MRTATPTKLATGAWGVKVANAITPGETVQVSTKAGKTWESRIDKVLWYGKGISICSVVARVQTAGSSKGSSAGSSKGSSKGSSSRRYKRECCSVCRGAIQSCGYQQATSDMCGACAYDDL